MKAIYSENEIQFLAGGGEMGKLILEKKWNQTSLGSPELWPQSLRTTLSIILNSKFPMFLFWGKDLICFYNDAFRPSLGKEGKHPSILGIKGEKAWSEIWHTIKPLIDQVLAGGEAIWSEDQLIPIYRNGNIEDVYWTFSYSPVNDETGKAAGVFVTCTETTDKIIAGKKNEQSKNEYKELSGLLEEKVKERTLELQGINEALKHSEEKFNKLFTASPLGLTLTEIPSGKLIDVNQTQLQMLGYTREEYVGRKSLELDIADKIDRDKILAELQQKGFIKNAEVNIRRKSGEKIPVLNSIETIPIGNKEYFLSAIIDITYRKRTEDNLRQSEERYHRMIEEVQDYAIILLSQEGIIQNWNKGAETIKGYKAEEIVGKSFSVFYTAEDQRNKIPEKLLSLAREKGKATDENWRVRKDGSKFWGSIVITALHDNKNNITGFVKVTRDLTERKFAEEEIKAKARQLEVNNTQLEKMNKELQSFAYISSHDLQEPLRKIQTFATRILEKERNNLSEDGKDNFKRMQEAAKRMQTLIEDLLSYSRTTTTERKRVGTDLNKLVEEVKEDLKEDLNEKHATIESSELCVVEIIPFQFRQLMHNLIGNSLKFADPKRPPLIKIKSEIAEGNKFFNKKLLPQKKYCHISIADNGIGFEQQYNEKIFELFQRLHGRSKYNGTGIGLSIVKKIVDNHEGIITAKSEPNEGATFDIYLPLN